MKVVDIQYSNYNFFTKEIFDHVGRIYNTGEGQRGLRRIYEYVNLRSCTSFCSALMFYCLYQIMPRNAICQMY